MYLSYNHRFTKLMAGFFGLFGGKDKYVDEPDNSTPEEQSGAYYLNSDDAKTLGNIDYMRTPNKSRRTFPKTLKNPNGFELNTEVSAMELREIAENGAATNGSNAVPQPQANNTNGATNSRRRADNNMEMWRNLARDMRK
jgi:hypothetical protein